MNMNMDFNSLSHKERHNELVRVLDTMQRYNRTEGWMRWDGDIMRFYDGEVEEGCYVEIAWVKFWVDSYNEV
jgi:hypothetical protein